MLLSLLTRSLVSLVKVRDFTLAKVALMVGRAEFATRGFFCCKKERQDSFVNNVLSCERLRNNVPNLYLLVDQVPFASSPRSQHPFSHPCWRLFLKKICF